MTHTQSLWYLLQILVEDTNSWNLSYRETQWELPKMEAETLSQQPVMVGYILKFRLIVLCHSYEHHVGRRSFLIYFR